MEQCSDGAKPAKTASDRARQYRSTSPNVELTASTFYAVRTLADHSSESMCATIFKLAHERVTALLQTDGLPTPFEVDRLFVGPHPTFRVSHPDLDQAEMTLTQFQVLTTLIDLRVPTPLVRQFDAAFNGVEVNVRRNRQGVRIRTNERRLNLSIVEAAALVQAFERLMEPGQFALASKPSPLPSFKSVLEHS